MLLEHLLLNAVARAWRVRERVEREAARLFAGLAVELDTAGVDRTLVRLADQAARDELEHATRCRRICDAREPGLAPLALGPPIRLGPADLSPRRRLLYEAVAISCVTETMSVALLGAMRDVVTEEQIAETVRHILADEVSHARLGWAVLAAEAKRTGVAWLEPHLPGMIRAAVHEESSALPAEPGSAGDLSQYGVLTRVRVDEVVRETLDQVILPGLRSLGIG